GYSYYSTEEVPVEDSLVMLYTKQVDKHVTFVAKDRTFRGLVFFESWCSRGVFEKKATDRFHLPRISNGPSSMRVHPLLDCFHLCRRRFRPDNPKLLLTLLLIKHKVILVGRCRRLLSWRDKGGAGPARRRKQH